MNRNKWERLADGSWREDLTDRNLEKFVDDCLLASPYLMLLAAMFRRTMGRVGGVFLLMIIPLFMIEVGILAIAFLGLTCEAYLYASGLHRHTIREGILLVMTALAVVGGLPVLLLGPEAATLLVLPLVYSIPRQGLLMIRRYCG